MKITSTKHLQKIVERQDPSDIMATGRRDLQSVEWKAGSKCDLFVRDKMEWNDGEIIGSFSDEKGKWIKVQCGQRVHNVLAIDPDLRVRKVLQSAQVMELERAATQIPRLQPILDDILPNTSEHGIYVFAHRESLVVLYEYMLYLVTSGHIQL